MKPPAGSIPAPADGDRVIRQLARQGVLFGVVMLVALALLMAVRRVAGAFWQPLPGSTLLLIGLLIALSAWGLRAAWHWASQPPERGPLDRFVLAAPSVSLLLIALAISLPASPAWGLLVCWGLFIVEETWAWRGSLRGPAGFASPGPTVGVTRANDTATPSDEASLVDVEEAEEADCELDLRQQVTRGIDATGNDVLLGTFRAPITAGQRNADIHIAFCPPFAHTPIVEAYHTEGPACRVNVPQVFPYGARIDVRLTEVADSPTAVVLEIMARETARRATGDTG